MNDKELLVEVEDIPFRTDDEIYLSEEEALASPLLEGDEEEEFVDVDGFTKHAGEYGRYQILIQSLVMFTVLPLTYPAMIFYYIGHGPMWKCNTTEEVHSICMNNTKSFDHTNTARCKMPREAWVFESKNKSTIVTEFDLVCERSWLDALSGSVVFIGWGVGIIVMGYLSDHYGRKRVMYPSLVLMLICLFLHAFVNNVGLLILLRFFMGLFFAAPALNSFVLIMELVGNRYRVIATTLSNFSWPVGALLLTLKAYYVDDWRTLCILCSAPYFLCVLTVICVPESVRWLNMKARKNEAEAILKKAAHINKKVLPPLLQLKHFDTSTASMKVSYLDLFKRCAILKLVFSQAFIWFSAGMTYYAMNWEFADIGGDMYVNFILSFMVEIPGAFLYMLTFDRFGRKRMTFIFLLITSFCCLGVVCIPKTAVFKTFRLTVGLLGKCTISIVFGAIYMWSSEIYSTVARTQGMAINVVTSRIGAACSPFLNILNRYHPAGSFILMTMTSVISTVLCVVLPETLNQPTRETFDDMLTPTPHTVQMPVVFNMNTNIVDMNENIPTTPYERMENEEGEEDNDLLLGNTENTKQIRT